MIQYFFSKVEKLLQCDQRANRIEYTNIIHINMPQKGFTLIELLLVLAILLALVGIVIFSLRPEIILTDTNEINRKVEVQNINKVSETIK